LTSYLPARSTEIKSFPWNLAIYFTTVYQIEMLRKESLSFDNICKYLDDDRFKDPNIYPTMESIAEKVLNSGIISDKYPYTSQDIIERHLKTLLLYIGNRDKRVRDFSIYWIKQILISVPVMLFNRSCTNFMLDILRFLDNEKIGRKEYQPEQLEFAEYISFFDPIQVEETSTAFYQFCLEWLELSLKISANETIALIQNYVATTSSSTPWMNPDEGKNSSLLMILFQTFFENHRMSSNLIKHSGKRAWYVGQVKGMLETYERMGINGFEKISTDFIESLRSVYENPNSPQFLGNFHTCICRSVALILLNDKVYFINLD
jgi:hypothetical protein